MVLAVSAACWLKAAPVEPDEIAETLRPIVHQAMEHREVPGLAIAVLRDGKTVYRQSVGVLDLASREPVTANTRFHLASVTKTFVATAVLQMAEQGMVDLDAHPHRYLPYFQPADPRAERITLRQLLAHTSGLQKDDDTRFRQP
jgi:CubicO group peptidase (beta-lactamase class C family)